MVKERIAPAEVDRVLADAEKLVREADVPYRVCWRVGDPVDEIANLLLGSVTPV